MIVKLSLLATLALAATGACRNDESSDALSWSCADHKAKKPTATPECYKKMVETKDPVLEYFFASPVKEAGVIVRYRLDEKESRRQ